MRIKKLRYKKYIFIFLIVLIATNMPFFCLQIPAETMPGHTEDLNIYRFIQILDVSNDGDVDVWIIVQLRFNQEENRTRDYFLKFILYQTNEDSIVVFPDYNLYADHLSYSLDINDDIDIEFNIDKNVNKIYEFYTFAFKYTVNEDQIVKKVSKWNEPYDRWRLKHFIGVPESICNLIRLCIILPDEAIVDKIEDFIEYDSVPDSIEYSSVLRFENNTTKKHMYIPSLNQTIYKKGIFLYKYQADEISTVFYFSTYQTLSFAWGFLLIIVIIGTIFSIFIAFLSAIKKPENFLLSIIFMIVFSIFSSFVSSVYFKDIKIGITILIAWISLIIAIFSIHFSNLNSNRTYSAIKESENKMRSILADVKRLIEDFEREQAKANKITHEKLDGITNKITNNAAETIDLQEYNPVKKENLKDKVKSKFYRKETSELVNMVSNVLLEHFDEVEAEYLLDDRKSIDFLIKLPGILIPIEIKRYAKRIVKTDIPLKLIDQMNSIMNELGTNESILIVLNPGFGRRALEIFNEFNRGSSKNKIYLIRGTKISSVRDKLIKFLHILNKKLI